MMDDCASTYTPISASVFPADGSHGHTWCTGCAATDWIRHAITAEANAAAAQRIENHAAGFPSRRSGNTIASTRNDSAGSSHAARARVPELAIIPSAGPGDPP